MASYRGHLVGGVLTFGLVLFMRPELTELGLIKLTIALTITLLGSLFPDIDTKSMGQKVFYSLLAVCLVPTICAQSWGLLTIFMILGLVPILVPHRGLTHSPYFLLIAPLFIIWLLSAIDARFILLPGYLYFFFVAGAMSHLILDYSPTQLARRLFFIKR